MVGAPKATKCSDCHGGRDAVMCTGECSQQHGFGHVPGRLLHRDRVYTLLTCLKADGTRDDRSVQRLRNNSALLLQSCRVRTTATAVHPGWRRFEGCPSHSLIRQSGKKPPQVGSKRRAFDDDRKSMQGWPRKTLDADDPRLARLTQIFRTRFGSRYARIELNPVRLNGKTYYCQFSGEGENECVNVGRAHSSNRVYGIVDPVHATLRCHSSTDGRHSGVPCRQFAFAKRLAPSDVAILFDHLTPEIRPSAKLKDFLFPAPEEMLQRISDEVHPTSSQ
jgi:hypothetical protein